MLYASGCVQDEGQVQYAEVPSDPTALGLHEL